MENHKIVGLPVMWVHQPRRNRRPLHLIQDVAHFLQVFDLCAVWIERSLAVRAGGERVDDELAHAAGVDLEMELIRDRVLPANWECLDSALLPRWELVIGKLEALGLDA